MYLFIYLFIYLSRDKWIGSIGMNSRLVAAAYIQITVHQYYFAYTHMLMEDELESQPRRHRWRT